MNPDQQLEKALEALKPIHLPEAVSWWPPAPGWWIATVLVLVLLALFIRQSIRWYGKGAARRSALAELDQIATQADDTQFAEDLQLLLRRYALKRFPDDDVSAMTGDRWIDFLVNSSGDKGFDQQLASHLTTAVYSAHGSLDREAAVKASRHWLARARPAS